MSQLRFLSSGFAVAPMVLLGAVAATAQTNTQRPWPMVYDCTAARSPDNMIGGRTFFGHNQTEGHAVVFDGFIKSIYGKAIPVTITANDAASVSFSWTVQGVKMSPAPGGRPVGPKTTAAHFTATIQKGTLGFEEAVTIEGYNNNSSGSGTCTLKRN